jgi:hypothetical protein
MPQSTIPCGAGTGANSLDQLLLGNRVFLGCLGGAVLVLLLHLRLSERFDLVVQIGQRLLQGGAADLGTGRGDLLEDPAP